MPYWELSSKVTDLSIGEVKCKALDQAFSLESASEEEIASFELPAVPFAGAADTHESAVLVLSVACRTLVAAARGPGLVRLALDPDCNGTVERTCFSIASLMPCWLSIEDWSWPARSKHDHITDSWRVAVMLLRAALAHTSHALRVQLSSSSKASPSGPDERHLRGRDVQGMHACFEQLGRPVLDKPTWRQDNTRANLVWGQELQKGTPFERYLAWLRDDAKLARQVAAAWNVVVDKGNADTFRCYCGKCYDARDLVGADE